MKRVINDVSDLRHRLRYFSWHALANCRFFSICVWTLLFAVCFAYGSADPFPDSLGTNRFRHTSAVTSLAISKDGRILVSGERNGVVRIWEIKTGTELLRHVLGMQDTDRSTVDSITLTSDGRRYAASNGFGIWFGPTHGMDKPVLRVRPVRQNFAPNVFIDSRISRVGFSPCDKLLAWADDTGSINVKEKSNDRTILTIPSRTRHFVSHISTRFVFSNDSKVLAFSAEDGSIRLWDIGKANECRRFAGHPDSSVSSIVYSKDGTSLISSGKDGTIKAWSLSDGKERWSTASHGTVYVLAVSDDGKLIASGHRESVIRLWTIDTKNYIRQFQAQRSQRSGITALAFLPDQKTLISAGEDESLHFWDVANGIQLNPDEGHEARVLAVTFSPHKHLMASASSDRTVRIWDTSTRKQLHVLEGHTNRVRGVKYTADEKRLISVDDDGTIIVWNSTSVKPEFTIKAIKGANGVLCESGSRIISYRYGDGTIQVFDPDHAKEYAEVNTGLHIRGVAYSSNAEEIAVVTDEDLSLWSLRSRTETMRVRISPGDLCAATYSRDGRLIAIARGPVTANSCPVSVFERASGEVIKDAPLISSPNDWRAASSVEFLSGSRALACGCDNGTILFWDWMSSNVMWSHRKECGDILGIAYQERDGILATACADTTIRLWKSVDYVRPLQAHTGALDKLPRVEFARMWNRLGSEKGQEAFAAMGALLQSPVECTRFLGEVLRPKEEPNVELAQQCLSKLSSTTFKERDRAVKELGAMRELVLPQLEERLQSTKDLQEVVSLRRLIKEARTYSKEDLLNIRAIQTLEYIGTREAEDALVTISRGFHLARLTKEASASVARLTASRGHHDSGTKTERGTPAPGLARNGRG